jgi:hypothetical protein
MTTLHASLAPRPRDAEGPTGEPPVEEPDMSTGAIFILCVIAMLPTLFLIALGVKLRELREARRWPETTGKVIASRVQSLRKTSAGPSFGPSDMELTNQPFVQYEYKVGRRTYRCSRVSVAEQVDGAELRAILERYPVGKAVTVYYDPARPERALLERTLPAGKLALGLGCLMAIFVGGPLAAVFLYHDALAWLKTRVADPRQAGLVAVSTGFGLFVTLMALASWRSARQESQWPVARGRVIRSEVEKFEWWDDEDSGRHRGRLGYRADVIYSYEVDGLTYQGDCPEGVAVSSSSPDLARRTTAKYPVGSEVEVHYNPLSPGESVVNPGSVLHLFLWPIAAALVAFAWALATGRLW